MVYYEYDVERVYEDINDNGGRSTEHFNSGKSEQDISIIDNSSDESIVLEIAKKCKLDIPVTYNTFEPAGSTARK